MGMHDIKVVHRLFILIIIPLLAMLGMLVVAISGFNRIDAGVGSLYDDRVVPLQQLKQISDYYAVNIIDAVNKADHGLFSRDQAQGEINTAQSEIARLWQAYIATRLTRGKANWPSRPAASSARRMPSCSVSTRSCKARPATSKASSARSTARCIKASTPSAAASAS